jgi:hypothetical protein
MKSEAKNLGKIKMKILSEKNMMQKIARRMKKKDFTERKMKI